MCIAHVAVYDAFADTGMECTITSANDGVHGENSLHSRDGLCRALDYRTKDFRGDKLLLRDRLKVDLGDEFDVVLEHLGEDNEHLHVEYDPE